ncbi:hypothetical protein F7725_011061, partial [Dissostichus mawsoni]
IYCPLFRNDPRHHYDFSSSPNLSLIISFSITGKTWWMLMLVLRLPVVLLAGFTLFSDEQETFVCNTIQPGCSNVCFDAFAPVSIFRLWLFHLMFLCLPHVLFATYVMHKVWSNPILEVSTATGRGENSSREVSLHKAPLHDLPHDLGAPRFYCTYFLVVILRIVLEMVFSACQFLLFGLSVPKSFLCYETPCNSGVECYISKPTEKTLMLNFMLGVASLSILLSLVDLVSSMKAMMRWRRNREMKMDEMSKGEQSSVFTTTSITEDSDVVITRKISRCESSKNGFKDERHAVPNGEPLHKKVNNGTANDKSPENKEGKIETSPPIPTHSVLHSQLRPPQSPRPERGPPTNSRMQTPVAVRKQVKENSGQQSDSSDNQDKRAWDTELAVPDLQVSPVLTSLYMEPAEALLPQQHRVQKVLQESKVFPDQIQAPDVMPTRRHINLGAPLFDYTPDPEQRDEPGQQKHGADEQVDHQGCQHETSQVIQILVAHVANPSHRVSVH